MIVKLRTLRSRGRRQNREFVGCSLLMAVGFQGKGYGVLSGNRVGLRPETERQSVVHIISVVTESELPQAVKSIDRRCRGR